MIKHTLDEVLENYILYLNYDAKVSKATVNRYESAIRLLLLWLKEIQSIEHFEEIKSSNLQAYFDKPNEITGMIAKDRTRAVIASAIKHLYRWAMDHNIVNSDVSRLINRPHVSEQIPEILLLEDALKLEKASIQRKFSSRDYLITLLFLLRGLRVSEVASLDINKINLKNGTITYKGKGGNTRTLYLTNKLKMALEKYIPERQVILTHRNKMNEQALFISEKRGERLTRRGIQLIMDEIAQMSNVKTIAMKKITPNKLRHTCAAMLYSDGDGANISDIAELLGLKDKYNANKYTKLKKENKINPSVYSTNPLEST